MVRFNNSETCPEESKIRPFEVIEIRGKAGKFQKVLALVCLLSIQVLLLPLTVAADTSSKKSESQQVQTEVNRLNAELSEAIEKYNQASSKLEEINNKISENEQQLERVAKELARSLQIINKRASGIYKHGSVYAIEVIFGSKSIDDFVQRLDLLTRIGNQDAAVVRQVEAQKKEVERGARELNAEREQQAAITRDLAAKREDIDKRLSDKENVLASLLSEIARIDEEEAARAAKSARERSSGSSRSGGQASRRTGAALYPPLGNLTYSLLGDYAPGERSDHGTGYGTGGSKPGHNVWIPGGDAYDLMSGSGVVAYAAHNGTVTESGGNYLILEGDGYMTAYGHIEPFYGAGAYVVAGQPLGVVDGVGHLQFELWVGGDPVVAGDIASYF